MSVFGDFMCSQAAKQDEELASLRSQLSECQRERDAEKYMTEHVNMPRLRNALANVESLQQQLQQMTREREEYRKREESLNAQLKDVCELAGCLPVGEELEHRVKELKRDAQQLQQMSNEVTGMMVAFESEIRGAISNTNYTCVMNRLTAARALVSGKESRFGH